MSRTVVMIMAGGKGSRLAPLTCHRAKPAVPFAGRYRIIDFVLSNFVNSGYRRIYVLTQYMASSLIKHLNRNWHLGGVDHYIEVVPAQMRTGAHWYQGTADAVFQNLNLVRDSRSEHVAVFGGDHIYKFAIDQMEAWHVDQGADLTIAACPVPRSEAHAFGVIQVDDTGRIVGFQEKPDDPVPIPGRPDTCLVSMGDYLFRSKVLQRALVRDAQDSASQHDFGEDIIPRLLADEHPLYAYDFGSNRLPGEPEGVPPYWRDVGTIDGLVAANMEVRSAQPFVNLYNRRWRVRTAQRDYPPARFIQDDQGAVSTMDASLICEGSVVSSARLVRSVVGYDCYVHALSEVVDCVLFSGCNVGDGATLHKVLMDKNCSVAPGVQIGVDPEADRARFPFVSDGGIVSLPKGTHVPREGPIALARDIAIMLQQDPATQPVMARMQDGWTIAERVRHSYDSSGPRFRHQGDQPPILDGRER